MSEETNNTLRQAEAKINIEGILTEKKLEVKPGKDGKNTIQGELSIKTSDTNTVKVRVFVTEFTKAGEQNKAWAGMNTVMRDFHSVAEVGLENAMKVQISSGNIRLQTYMGKNGLQEGSVSYGASFVNHVDEAKAPYNPHATFEVEGYVKSIVPEVNKEGEGTGRLKLNLWVPTYDGIEPMTLFVPEHLADQVQDIYEPGQTAQFDGELKNNVIVKEQVIHRAIGGDKTKNDYTYIDERVMTGGSYPYEEEKAYSAEAIKIAVANREASIEEMKKNGAAAKQAANKGNVANNVSTSGRTFGGFNGFKM